MDKAVVLFSGGLDSATCLLIAKQMGYQIIPVVIDYSQRHSIERKYAQKMLEYLKISSAVFLSVDLSLVGGSALTDDIQVPKGGEHLSLPESIPITYVPARNLIFLSLAIGVAEVKEAQAVFIGVNALDYSGYPDCRDDFIRSFEQTCNLASRSGREGKPFCIKTPLSKLNKAEIVQKGASLGVPYEYTWSCYDPQKQKPCGECDSCLLRRKGFQEADMIDPLFVSSLPFSK